MRSHIHVPNSLRSAAREVRFSLSLPLEKLPNREFVRAWCSLAYLFPALHPDGYEDDDSGWPRVLRRFAAEAWRRAESEVLTEEELYPSDAQWAGIYDRMFPHTAEEIEHRLLLAGQFGDGPVA